MTNVHQVLAFVLVMFVHTSMEKSTPPMGEPKATATPAALEAVKISRIFTVQMSHESKSNFGDRCVHLLREKPLKALAMRFPTQHATCTEGPSFPTDKPDAMTRGWTTKFERAPPRGRKS